ncbi:hypothetical protein NC651_016249 [Populus alba x Populus x berolinensis]|nr:hypothetical protein NC651_016249 [Populus alba x Populus x berolinensis]
MLDGSISHIPRADLPPFPIVNPPRGAGTSTTKETYGSSVDHSNASLDGFLEDYRSKDEELEEEQLDFSYSKEEYATSPPPSSPAPVTPEPPSSPTLVVLESPASPKVDITGNKAPHRPGSGVLTRSSVQRISNRFSSSGGVPATLPHP